MNKKNVLTIRIPEDLKERIEKTAATQGVSLNQFALYAFTRGISDIDTANFFKKRIQGKSKDSIEDGFKKVMGKVGKKDKVPTWDKL
ncbi:toxin-antitoxin system HicB family antitoxin [Leptospira sp. WS39.C2]